MANHYKLRRSYISIAVLQMQSSNSATRVISQPVGQAIIHLRGKKKEGCIREWME
jgi:hypothetical protein